ncbi:molecular chaperone Tir [Helicobacter sp. CLO-3]|uniref:TIR domain-containing protein n=1 Tax=unclassified Helicobacter TaxID=2593540 RepID=UPI000805D8C5|nr:MULTISPECIES: TIR domain-containing protein [unclassified Helicobacter]OBV29821.1 molecular chaperone Tir [Helicobacter sp. CLO-3]OHU83971.1 molecular chaperone Tir [Helicobacter sp. CLO-3]
MNQTYYIFISHSWAYHNEYEGLTNLLNNSSLRWQDYSVPKNDPIHTTGSDRELYEAIEKKIKSCSCVLILAGLYANYSKWINKEIEMAKKYNKKIIAVEKWGSQKTSAMVKENATHIVSWQKKSIVDAIIEC